MQNNNNYYRFYLFFSYISLLIIPCMIVYVTNNKEPWEPNLHNNNNS